MQQIKMDIPKDKRDLRVMVKLNYADMQALEIGMAKVGETNKSSYIRRLIHERK
jgi:hypothetical protein